MITYEDNCGGFMLENIDDIFDYQMSTKEDGHGIGLAILKMLITDKLKGSIKVKNITNGVQFMIKIPHY